MLLSITGIPEKGGIPRKSEVRIEAMPKRRCIFTGKVSNAANIDLDPGKYAICITKMVKGRRDLNVSYSYQILHGLTEEQWTKFQFQRATKQKVLYTSDGFRWRCQWPGCDVECTSRIGAYIHECQDHLEIDPIAATDGKMRVLQEKQDEIKQEISRIRGSERDAALDGLQAMPQVPKRTRGRPRKVV